MEEEGERRGEVPPLSFPTLPPSLFFFFPAHIFLRRPHDLNTPGTDNVQVFI